ncbi:hypothetical protein QR685DRAFT_547729 [Neurospora intermedia]|uniref:Uncharacterized protein n=1 Tax=Neurospora intermedia TaxID=5142 RepID=A0ABR3D1T8_NEUIN
MPNWTYAVVAAKGWRHAILYTSRAGLDRLNGQFLSTSSRAPGEADKDSSSRCNTLSDWLMIEVSEMKVFISVAVIKSCQHWTDKRNGPSCPNVLNPQHAVIGVAVNDLAKFPIDSASSSQLFFSAGPGRRKDSGRSSRAYTPEKCLVPSTVASLDFPCSRQESELKETTTGHVAAESQVTDPERSVTTQFLRPSFSDPRSLLNGFPANLHNAQKERDDDLRRQLSNRYGITENRFMQKPKVHEGTHLHIDHVQLSLSWRQVEKVTCL